MIRVGVLGAGSHSSKEHGPALKALKSLRPNEIELAAVCDIDEGRALRYAADFGFRRAYRDLDAMLSAEELDALVTVTPIPLTEPLAARLLPRRIPLLIEKPPGEDSSATRRLLALAREVGAPHMVSFNRRFNPALARARQWLTENAPGRPPRLVLGRMLRHARREADFAVGTGIHLVDAALSFLPRPDSVRTARRPGTVEGCYSFVAVAASGDALAVLVISPEAGVSEETYELHGPDYCVRIDAANASIRVLDGGREALSWAAPAGSSRECLTGTLGETEAFLDCARARRPCRPDLEDGLVAMLVSEAVQAGRDARITPE